MIGRRRWKARKMSLDASREPLSRDESTERVRAIFRDTLCIIYHQNGSGLVVRIEEFNRNA